MHIVIESLQLPPSLTAVGSLNNPPCSTPCIQRIRVLRMNGNVDDVGIVGRCGKSPFGYAWHRPQRCQLPPSVTQVVTDIEMRRFRSGEQPQVAVTARVVYAIDVVGADAVSALLPTPSIVLTDEQAAVVVATRMTPTSGSRAIPIVWYSVRARWVSPQGSPAPARSQLRCP